MSRGREGQGERQDGDERRGSRRCQPSRRGAGRGGWSRSQPVVVVEEGTETGVGASRPSASPTLEEEMDRAGATGEGRSPTNVGGGVGHGREGEKGQDRRLWYHVGGK
jgi:hypothetical protein